MRILLAGDYPADPRLGSTKVLVKLQEEFRAQGHTCDLLLADGLSLAPQNPYLRQALAPIAALTAVKRLSSIRGAYDVIDVASAEGLWIAASRSGPLRRAVVISRSNGLEHLNYRRMLDDHAAGLLHKPWTRRLYHPLVRLTQVAAAARAADRLLLLNDADRRFALEHGWKPSEAIDVVPHGVSSRFLDRPRQLLLGQLLGALDRCQQALSGTAFAEPLGQPAQAFEQLLGLAAAGYVAVGTVLAAMTVRTRFADLMMPVLLLAFLVPPVLVGVLATTRLLGGRPIGEIRGLVQILVLYDVVFITLGLMLFPATMDE